MSNMLFRPILAIILISGGVGLYVFGYRAGAMWGIAKAAQAQAQVISLTAEVNQANGEIQKNQQQAAMQEIKAKTLINNNENKRNIYAKEIAKLQQHLQQAVNSPSCSVLKETLCSAVSYY